MKKTLRYYTLILLAAAVVVFGVLGLAACNSFGKKIVELSIVNAKINFMIGDEFEYGENFAVYAVFSDDSRVNVTEDCEITKETGFDMNTPGDYQITVKYGGKTEIYTVYVGEFEPILRKLTLNTEKVKKSYSLGETVSYDGLSVTLTYENAQGVLSDTVTDELNNFDFEITDEKGNVVRGALMKLATFKVTVFIGSIEDSYNVVVDKADISTVAGALAVAKIYQSEVVSGTQVAYGQLPKQDDPTEHVEFNHLYTYGNNYTYVKETVEENAEWHLSIEDEEIFCIKKQNGQSVNPGAIQSSMMEGPETLLFYNSVHLFGIENALLGMYERGLECTNGDLKVTANEATREYTFEYSGLIQMSNTEDFFRQSVSFKLGEKLNIEHAEITEKYWEKNVAGTTFNTDANGITTEKGVPSKIARIITNQVVGERTAVNPYPKSAFKPTSFNIKYNGKVVSDGGAVELSASSGSVSANLYITDMLPETASYDHYPMYLDYEGNPYSAVNMNGGILSAAGWFNIHGDTFWESISVTIYHGGDFTLIVTMGDLTKTVKFKVKGTAPTSFTPQIRNDITGVYQNLSSKTLGIGGTVHFKAAANQYANDDQTAVVTSANKANATIEEVVVGGKTCFKFSATEAGTYTVKVSSTVNSVSCTYTFTVQDAPDYAAVLTGKYSGTDWGDSLYEVEFTPNNEGGLVKGTVVVKYTPANEDDGTLQPDKAQTQTLSYRVDTGKNEIVLESISGTNLGIDLSVELDGKFVLLDKWSREVVMTPAAN